MRIRNKRREDESPKLQMSAMTDVVFLLLVFFVMTFQITALEGDVPIDTTSLASGPGDEPRREFLLYVHLRAHPDGSLKHIQFDGRQLSSIAELHEVVTSIVTDGPVADFQVALRSDAALRYQHAMDAITAIRGDPENQPLIETIRFVNEG